MQSLLSQASQPISVLLIEPDRDLAHKLLELLFGHFQTTLDLALADSLHGALAYLSTHQVPLILMDLALSDYKPLDAVHTLRLTAPVSGLIAYGSAVNEPLRLDAVRAGAHEVLSIAGASADTFRLAVECAMVRAKQPTMQAGLPALPKLAHDLNNAVTSINGFADILLTRLPADEPSRAYAEQIKKAGTRATALVKSLTSSHESSPAVSATDSAETAQAALSVVIVSSN